jgi:hypothetical protein
MTVSPRGCAPGHGHCTQSEGHYDERSSNMRSYVSGIYGTRVAAELGVQALVDGGFAKERISVLFAGKHRDQHFGDVPPGSNQGSNVGEGAAIGGMFGAIVGGFAAIASLAIPGGILVAGPIAAAIGGGAVGLAGGSLLGALVGAGIPEQEARYYEQELERGGILVSVEAESQRAGSVARSILDRAGARSTRAEQVASAPANRCG